MAEMMICPKAGECRHKMLRGDFQTSLHDRCSPHKKLSESGSHCEHFCPLDGDTKRVQPECPPCVPYKGETVKYIATGKITNMNKLYYDVMSDGCDEVAIHFNSMVVSLKPSTTDSLLHTGSLVEWAEQDPKRITWLLEKGYIEKVESEYDRWVGEVEKYCVGRTSDVAKATREIISLAEIMPK